MKILIVDDEKTMVKIISSTLEEKKYFVKACTSSMEALHNLQKEDYDLLITDIMMPELDGMELLEKAKKLCSDIEVIIMTAFATVETAIKALRLGAYDYLIKPFSLDELEIKIKRLQETKRIYNELREHRSQEEEKYSKIIGRSKAIDNVRILIEKVAKTDATVLITGESGVGKELIARQIHKKSSRSNGPFIAINCAAITETLLESELFGYEKGAFTGAVKSKPGRFELATGGTILLDEIGDMPLSIQAKLLRVLEEKKVNRLGGIQPTPIDTRIITATNKSLEKMIKESDFRQDLYFRISVFPIHIPPVRERTEDIDLLIENFFEKHNIPIKNVDIEFLRTCRKYDWPGNVRELINVLERSLILAEGENITADLLPFRSHTDTISNELDSNYSIEQLERKLLIKALIDSEGNKTKASEKLGITRRMLYTRLEKYGIKDLDFK